MSKVFISSILLAAENSERSLTHILNLLYCTGALTIKGNCFGESKEVLDIFDSNLEWKQYVESDLSQINEVSINGECRLRIFSLMTSTFLMLQSNNDPLKGAGIGDVELILDHSSSLMAHLQR
jgi:hypothetical protein